MPIPAFTGVLSDVFVSGRAAGKDVGIESIEVEEAEPASLNDDEAADEDIAGEVVVGISVVRGACVDAKRTGGASARKVWFVGWLQKTSLLEPSQHAHKPVVPL